LRKAVGIKDRGRFPRHRRQFGSNPCPLEQTDGLRGPQADFGTMSSESGLERNARLARYTGVSTIDPHKPTSRYLSRSYPELYLDSEVFGCFRLHGVQRLSDQNSCSLDLLTEVGTQGERAVIVQFLVTSPPHRITHSFYLYLSSKFQSFPFDGVRNHELCLSNLAR